MIINLWLELDIERMDERWCIHG